MKNAVARHLSTALLCMVAGSVSLAEDYQCTNSAGCVGRIEEDGELIEVVFRRGDMVSTEAGWIVSTDDGWVKVRTKNRATAN